MLTNLRLINFKAFADQLIPLHPLTLLTGLNGMGKSSVLQALLLLRQSYTRDKSPTIAQLVLNGELVQLGTGPDVLFENAAMDSFGFALDYENRDRRRIHTAVWEITYDRTADNLDLRAVPDYLEDCPLVRAEFHYLQAERLGPRPFSPMSTHLVRDQRQIGTRGEYTAHFLDIFQDFPIKPKILRHPQAPDSIQLKYQVEAWLNEISPGTRISLLHYPQMDLIQISFAFERRGKASTKDYRPTNVGFGITYTLPILVAILSATPGTLILLENPEAHLHPKGQAKMGELLARAASAGIQLIVETHSDHILNGIRVAAKQGIINPNQVALHFFHRPNDADQVEITTPNLDKDGRIDYWPPDFFDEWDKALDELL